MIDTVTTLKTIVQPNIKFIALVAFVVILAMRYLESNVLQILFLLSFAFLNHKEFLGIIEDIQHSEKKVERVIEDNRRKKKEVHFNEDLDHLPFLTRCVMETLRLWTAVPNGTFRELQYDDYVKGPGGEMVKLEASTHPRHTRQSSGRTSGRPGRVVGDPSRSAARGTSTDYGADRPQPPRNL